MNDLAGQILAALHKIAPDVEPASVDHKQPLVDQLDLDSMDYQNLLTAISIEHQVPIVEEAIPRLRSVDDLVEYVKMHRTQRNPS